MHHEAIAHSYDQPTIVVIYRPKQIGHHILIDECLWSSKFSAPIKSGKKTTCRLPITISTAVDCWHGGAPILQANNNKTPASPEGCYGAAMERCRRHLAASFSLSSFAWWHA